MRNIIRLCIFALCFQTLVIVPFALNEELDFLFKEEENEHTRKVGTCNCNILRTIGIVNIKEREIMEERLGFMTKRFRRKNKKWQVTVSVPWKHVPNTELHRKLLKEKKRRLERSKRGNVE